MIVSYAQAGYTSDKHTIYHAVYDRDWFSFSHSVNIPLLELTIDEVDPDNKAVCQDIVRRIKQTDVDGEHKYYIDDQGQLCENVGWGEYRQMPNLEEL